MAVFQTLILGYVFSWWDIQLLLANCYIPLQREKILTGACREVDEDFSRDPHPADAIVPPTEPHWDYNTKGGMQRRAHMLKAILHGMKSGAMKPEIITRLKESFRKKREPYGFL
jgi:hypothetical protein